MALPTHSRTRRLATIALPTALVVGLTACSGSSGSSGGGSGSSGGGKEPQTITLTYASSNTTEDAYDTLAKSYMASHPGVTVKTNRVALNAYDSTLTTQMQAGNGPDVMYINSGSSVSASIGVLAKGNLLLALSDAVKVAIPEPEVAGYSYGGKLYGAPVSTAISGIVYNDVLAKENGVNLTAKSTFEDVLSACATAKTKGKTVFGLAGSTPQNTGILAMEIASSLVYGPNENWNADRASGKVKFATDEGWKKTLQSIVDLYKNGCFQGGAAGAGFDALTNGASSGKLFGFFAPSGATKDIMDAAKGHVKLVVLPFPAPAGTQTTLAINSDIGLAVNAKTKSPKLAEDFVKFMQTPAETKKFADAQGSIPTSANIDPASLLPQYAPVADMLANKQFRTFGNGTWPNPQVYNTLGTGVTGLLTGQKSIDDVLKAMDAAWGA